ncbi:phosphoribosylglycinamide formyltransferase [Caballeronia grimmiae]|uniref:Phosphoribosylglycinamide formyltransferase n=1 Tax=Caballeronia grimmiae TaxID=1071679 RepID=A0A069NPF7_9BURK|nr:phosphoribosylglycinamide formyltransferase [Caballeronia grimmiae]KDR30250.1 phosphoribosylglycinamide formyltransferase [Caballeronia grimmiae]GGD56997.1 phosphoribosylglycinamide formyltransferase [Caballeronia grimmiae]
MKKIVILISGRGSNMEAVVRACAREGWPARVAAVVSNRPDAAGLGFAGANGIDTAVVDHRAFDDRGAFDAALAREIDRFEPDLVVLAGFMRVLTDAFVERYAGRMLNVHPSLLPCFPGLRTHQQALDAGVRVHGASVHFVTPTLDHGPIVAQAAVPVIAGDDAAALAARVLTVEHIIYPRAVRWFIEGRLAIEGERVALTPSEPQWLFADIAGEGV